MLPAERLPGFIGHTHVSAQTRRRSWLGGHGIQELVPKRPLRGGSADTLLPMPVATCHWLPAGNEPPAPNPQLIRSPPVQTSLGRAGQSGGFLGAGQRGVGEMSDRANPVTGEKYFGNPRTSNRGTAG